MSKVTAEDVAENCYQEHAALVRALEQVRVAAYAVHHGLTMITARRLRASALERLRKVLGE